MIIVITVRGLEGRRAREDLRKMQKALLPATLNIARTFKVVILWHHRNCYIYISIINT